MKMDLELQVHLTWLQKRLLVQNNFVLIERNVSLILFLLMNLLLKTKAVDQSLGLLVKANQLV